MKKGQIAWNKGKKYEETYSPEKVKMLKEKSKNNTGFDKISKEKLKEIVTSGGKAVQLKRTKEERIALAKKMGKNSRKFENSVADSLGYKKMFLPQSICDRIVIVNGKPLLIEIKHKGDKLTSKQKNAQLLLGEYFKVVER